VDVDHDATSATCSKWSAANALAPGTGLSQRLAEAMSDYVARALALMIVVEHPREHGFE
jgi:hypothetical protein